MIILKPLLGILWLISSVYCSGGGESTTFRKQDDQGNYKFGYDVNDGYGGNHFHKETGDEYGNKRGSYGILGPDGRMRIVHYIADEHGFRVDMKSNENGVTNKDSASAVVNGKDIDENSEYSSNFGQRTPGYSPLSSLYLSSTSNHPSSSSKPYHLNSLSSPKSDHHSSDIYSSTPAHETYPYIPVKPKSYSNYALAAKSYYPKNVAYKPKYNPYPKPIAYEAPSYSSSYNSPAYGSTSDSSEYEPSNYPTPVHKPSYSLHDYNSAYESPAYGARKTPYTADLYSKSAEPVLSYAKLSGYSTKKHSEKIKYFNEPYEHPVSSTIEAHESSKNPSKASLVTTVDNTNTVEKKIADEEVAASYRTEPKSGVISTKLNPKISALIGLTSYKNPYSIDSDYKSS